jgi:hypothetical protein
MVLFGRNAMPPSTTFAGQSTANPAADGRRSTTGLGSSGKATGPRTPTAERFIVFEEEASRPSHHGARPRYRPMDRRPVTAREPDRAAVGRARSEAGRFPTTATSPDSRREGRETVAAASSRRTGPGHLPLRRMPRPLRAESASRMVTACPLASQAPRPWIVSPSIRGENSPSGPGTTSTWVLRIALRPPPAPARSTRMFARPR